ncbi:RNA-directed DNA polymerase from mobile element jockey [Araneus ventricosus]|uniref:RNA-directed DNA polymerase from mobile element jockey n=2 Tax=Araneus ventricosus TaxID=182803 RepID=A0A4Y2LE80_ARAVE|nr:RNA-directed DNA polymerase from mobile element jockey [Araneus ventricosus]
MENSEKGNPTEFGLKILQKLYPKIAPRAAEIQPHQSLMEEQKLSQQEIDDIVKKIPNGKAPGYDGIDNIIVKVIFNSFPSLLSDFFNKCLELKCFPDPLKIRLVIMFHKTGKEEQNIKSFRPISLLPTLGKWLEKLLLQRFNFQLKTKKKLQHPLQYGFREGKSADDALLHVTSLL